jgi:dihydropteroate synthase-like protein
MDSIDVPCVLIPGDRKGRVPHASLERIRILEELIGKAGDKKVIADPILQPVNAGFTESVKAYAVFREKHPTIPLLLGAGNVTELLDADSPGVNALLAGIASELDVDLLFTTEASPKTRGSVEELATAARLMYLSKTRKQSPKDLGIDLLFLKDKRKSEQPTDPAEKGIISFEALKRPADKLDDRYYRIYVTDRINAVCYIDKKPLLRITGDKAENIYKELIARGLIKDPGHSAYLGKELYKAETALRLGKNYVQDGELFREG